MKLWHNSLRIQVQESQEPPDSMFASSTTHKSSDKHTKYVHSNFLISSAFHYITGASTAIRKARLI